MGGKVVMRYTLENPGIVSRIIIVDVSLRTYVNHTHHQQLIRAIRENDRVFRVDSEFRSATNFHRMAELVEINGPGIAIAGCY